MSEQTHSSPIALKAALREVAFFSPERPVLVTGSRGQVGSALLELLGPAVIGLDRAGADLSQPATIAAALDLACKDRKPCALINAAAYTLVDQAEKERELAQAINGTAPGLLALWAAQRGIPFVHYSTDYVFSGEGETAWTEESPVSPLNTYGLTKLAGEKEVERAGRDFLIFRTSWVYDATGRNFLNTMLRLGGERELLKVVSDQHGAPTYAPHLAAATLIALNTAMNAAIFPSGVYHLCGEGETTWHGFAEAIFAEARARGASLRVGTVDPISSADFPTPARRPRNSRLSLEKSERILSARLPAWRDSLRECIDLKFQRDSSHSSHSSRTQ